MEETDPFGRIQYWHDPGLYSEQVGVFASFTRVSNIL